MTLVQVPNTFEFLKNRVILITGGSSGIGLSTAELFYDNGATVIIGDIKPPPTEKTSHWVYIKTDVSDWNSLLSFFKQAFERHGRIDAVIVNAGVSDASDMFMDTFDANGELEKPDFRSIETNLMGGLSCIKLAVHCFSRNTEVGGKIVIVGSLAGKFPYSSFSNMRPIDDDWIAYLAEPVPVYQASKHGLLGFMRSIRSSASKFNVSINMVAPWLTETPMVPTPLVEMFKAKEMQFNKPETVAKGIGFLICRKEGDEFGKNRDVNGETLVVAEDKCILVEEAIGQLRSRWLGEALDANYRRYEEGRWFRMPSGW